MNIMYIRLYGWDYDPDIYYHDGKPVEVLRELETKDDFGEAIYRCRPLDSSELLDVPERFLV